MHPHAGQPAAHDIAGQPWRTSADTMLRRDDTTRYLCAAAHLSSDFADQAIREYLLEPTRPMPPSPGVDTAAVLNEAIAGRVRRMLRDGAVVLLAVPVVFTAPLTWLLVWVAVAAGLSVATANARQKRERGDETVPAEGALQRKLAAAAAGFAILILVAIYVGRRVNGPDDTRDLGFDVPAPDHMVRNVFALLLVLAIAAVLTADRVAVWKALTARFRRVGGSGYDTGPRHIHNYAPSRQNEQVARVRQAQRQHADRRWEHPDGGPDVPLTVYRGYSPFVGAGVEVRPWSTATSLIPLPEGPEHALPGEAGAQPPIPASRSGDEPRGLSTTALYDRVRAEITELIRSTPLTPSARLRDLTVSGEVIASAEELLDHREDPSARLFLPSLDGPPSRWLPADEAARLRADPKEWARYYQCLRVETWDRELVVSVFLHLAVDHSTLYVEWTPCLLMPIQRPFRAIDNLSSSQLVPVWQGLVRLTAQHPRAGRGRGRAQLPAARRRGPVPEDPGEQVRAGDQPDPARVRVLLAGVRPAGRRGRDQQRVRREQLQRAGGDRWPRRWQRDQQRGDDSTGARRPPDPARMRPCPPAREITSPATSTPRWSPGAVSTAT